MLEFILLMGVVGGMGYIFTKVGMRHHERMMLHEENMKRLEKGYPPIEIKNGRRVTQPLIKASGEKHEDFNEYDEYNAN